MHIPAFGRFGLPINVEGPGTTWDELTQEFVKECGGRLCVKLVHAYRPAGRDSTPCGYVGMIPAEGARFYRGDTIKVIGAEPCGTGSSPKSPSPPKSPSVEPGTQSPSPSPTHRTPASAAAS